MDANCLEHCLTDEERVDFEKNGFLVVEDALSSQHAADLYSASSEIVAGYRRKQDLADDVIANPFDFIGRGDLFLDLLDWHRTFPKVWGILGWHIQLYHTHMTISPPAASGKSREKDGLGLGWHQDSGRLNHDYETTPRPRVSLKVGYFLTDTSAVDRGNFYIVPGSHLWNDFPGEGHKAVVEAAMPVCVPPGSAVFFDRRIWHSASNNYWDNARRVLFYGYSYRWLRPRDDMQVAHYLDRCDSIRKQLLGVSFSGGRGYTSPTEEDVPLKAWIEEHLGKEAVIP